MAVKTSSSNQTRARAKEVAGGGTAVRDRVRELTLGAFRDRGRTLGEVSKLVHEVLGGAVEGVDNSIPKSSKNVLREVFDGLREGVHAVASAGSAAASEARDRGQTITGKHATDAGKRIRAANEEFLGAVKSFAGKTSKQVREELDSLVARAERTAPKVTASAKKAAKATDGRLIELSGETARAGMNVVRRAAGTLAMGAGGFLEGLAEAIAPKSHPTTAKKPKDAPAKSAKRTPTKKAAKKKASSIRR